MVLEHGRAHVRRQSLALLAEHFQPHLRMLHHRLPLVGVQSAGLVQNQIRDSGLSDVVKEGAHPERSELVAIVSTVVRERGAIDADVHGMSVDGVVVHRLYQTRDAARRSRDLAGDLTYDAHRHFDVLWGAWREEDELSRRYGRVVHQGRFHIDARAHHPVKDSSAPSAFPPAATSPPAKRMYRVVTLLVIRRSLAAFVNIVVGFTVQDPLTAHVVI